MSSKLADWPSPSPSLAPLPLEFLSFSSAPVCPPGAARGAVLGLKRGWASAGDGRGKATAGERSCQENDHRLSAPSPTRLQRNRGNVLFTNPYKLLLAWHPCR